MPGVGDKKASLDVEELRKQVLRSDRGRERITAVVVALGGLCNLALVCSVYDHNLTLAPS